MPKQSNKEPNLKEMGVYSILDLLSARRSGVIQIIGGEDPKVARFISFEYLAFLFLDLIIVHRNIQEQQSNRL